MLMAEVDSLGGHPIYSRLLLRPKIFNLHLKIRERALSKLLLSKKGNKYHPIEAQRSSLLQAENLVAKMKQSPLFLTNASFVVS